jgi:hypothetical protein
VIRSIPESVQGSVGDHHVDREQMLTIQPREASKFFLKLICWSAGSGIPITSRRATRDSEDRDDVARQGTLVKACDRLSERQQQSDDNVILTTWKALRYMQSLQTVIIYCDILPRIAKVSCSTLFITLCA